MAPLVISFPTKPFETSIHTLETFTKDETLKKVHGDSIKIFPWTENKRIIHYSYDMTNSPYIIKKAAGNSSINITLDQTIHKKHDDGCLLENQFQFQGPLSKLVGLKTLVYFTKNTVTAHTHVKVFFLPPIRNYIRNYLYNVIQNEFANYEKALQT